MPAQDTCQPEVIRALQKDGWTVAEKGPTISVGRRRAFIDLQAARKVNGSREQIILLEVKCFPDKESTTEALYTAIGQYLIYRAMLIELGQILPLFLIVPEDMMSQVFDLAAQRVVQESRINMAIVNLELEEVVEWRG